MLISCIRGILLITAPDALLRVGKKFVKIQWMMKYKERKEQKSRSPKQRMPPSFQVDSQQAFKITLLAFLKTPQQTIFYEGEILELQQQFERLEYVIEFVQRQFEL